MVAASSLLLACDSDCEGSCSDDSESVPTSSQVCSDVDAAVIDATVGMATALRAVAAEQVNELQVACAEIAADLGVPLPSVEDPRLNMEAACDAVVAEVGRRRGRRAGSTRCTRMST